MNRNGFTLAEMMISLAIFLVVFCFLVAAEYSSHGAWSVSSGMVRLSTESRKAIAKIDSDLTNSNINVISYASCGSDCYGKKLRYRVPVADSKAVANTFFTDKGEIKYGANGKQNCYLEYKVNTQKQLVRNLVCGTVCGQYGCEPGETHTSCAPDCP